MKKHVILATMAILWGLSTSVTADVIIKSRTKIGPMLGIGTSESDITTYIKGDKNRTETSTSFKSQIFAMANQEDMTSATTEIYRLDKEVKWNLESRDESYREIYLETLHPSSGRTQGSSPDVPSSTGDAEDYAWTVNVDISKDSETVNGFDSKKAVVNAIGVNKNDISDSMFVTLKIWKSEELPNLSEIESYYTKFAGMTGLDEGSGMGKMDAYSSGFGDEFSESAKKIEEMEGFTVKTEMQVQKPSSFRDSETGGTKMSDMMKGLMDSDDGGAGESEDSNGKITLLSISDEVISVVDTDVEESMFEIPEGYIKKEQ